MKKRTRNEHGPRHVTPAGRSVFDDLGFDEAEAVVSGLAAGVDRAAHEAAIENFPIRNRTMALLTDATVIVEAGERSGALFQGWEALRLGRLLFLLENVATHPTLSWPKQLIHYGAQVLSRDNLEIALENLPAFTAATTIASASDA
ncbi:MAG TPA: DNA-processing protein DprA [Steroidobacteraceae bacterium]|nr:DNA-processing protein DprA [Steroidobacteraceae bacterium]